ncbi:MAG: two-component regulator propeller domain-containing protein, partial [Prevotella sp.]|nr:two-component regulator propeller domain-containing protein [Prevotella sp.]
FVNEDNTKVSVNYVRCVAEDKQGNMWIGTDAGPLMLEPDEFNSENPIFQQIKVPRNDGTNYADYLLAGIDITCMAIDGGNRKWFGTANNGIYLIDSDNMTEIQHFTASNSNLLSDNIESIAINEETGEVFIGTNKGLCSYMSDAIEPVEEMNKDVTYAYPNPVRPDYTGPITIVGLTMDADIKITTSNGVLVAQGRSNGGTFVWDGTDTNGKRVASGVYMVQTATAEGKKGTVCKIAIVN